MGRLSSRSVAHAIVRREIFHGLRLCGKARPGFVIGQIGAVAREDHQEAAGAHVAFDAQYSLARQRQRVAQEYARIRGEVFGGHALGSTLLTRIAETPPPGLSAWVR